MQAWWTDHASAVGGRCLHGAVMYEAGQTAGRYSVHSARDLSDGNDLSSSEAPLLSAMPRDTDAGAFVILCFARTKPGLSGPSWMTAGPVAGAAPSITVAVLLQCLSFTPLVGILLLVEVQSFGPRFVFEGEHFMRVGPFYPSAFQLFHFLGMAL